MRDHNSGSMRSVDWAGDLDSVLPKLKSLDVLVEVFPGLGKFVEGLDGGKILPDKVQYSSQNASNSVKELGLGRTKSEEEEYEYQESVEMMRQEKRENGLLLETVKMLQGSKVHELYEHEISVIRDSIVQKHELINKLHARALEFVHKTKDLEMELRDQDDTTKEARERNMKRSECLKKDIEYIDEDRQRAIQRYYQYQLLYSRTKEDRDDAESRMLQTRRVVDLANDDLKYLKEYMLNTIKVSQEDSERDLNSAVTNLEASREFWKVSLEQKNQEVSNLIRKYEKSKAERAEEEKQEQLEKLEGERERRDLEQRQKQEQNDIHQGLKRARKLQEEQWALVCAAAGVEPSSTATTVVGMFDAYTKLQVELESKIRDMGVSKLKSDTENSSSNTIVVEPFTVEGEEEACKLDPSPNAHLVHTISDVRIQMSLKHLQNKLKVFFDHERSEMSDKVAQVDDTSAEQETYTSLRRRSSMLSLHPRRMSAAQLQQKLGKKNKTDSSSLLPISTESGGFFDISSHIDKEELCRLFQKLAEMEPSGCVTNDQCSICKSPTLIANITENTHVVESMTDDASTLMGQTDTMPVKRLENHQEITDSQPKSVLGRRDIKSRSYKMKARFDKQKYQMFA